MGFDDDDYDNGMYDEYEIDGNDDEICEDYDNGDDDCDDDDDEICHNCIGENDDNDKICDNLEDDDSDNEINVLLMMIDGTDNGGITYYDYGNDKPLILLNVFRDKTFSYAYYCMFYCYTIIKNDFSRIYSCPKESFNTSFNFKYLGVLASFPLTTCL